MLTDKPWRERVLKDLGGMRKLKLWEAARERILARGGKPALIESLTDAEPSWLFTPERIAESERLKAYARKCSRAAAKRQTNIYRDRVKMDFDGMFSLPPLARARGGERKTIIYTAHSIIDYEYNGIPFAKEEGLGTAIVWPVEFYAAMGMSINCHSGAQSDPGRPREVEFSVREATISRPSVSNSILRGKREAVRNDRTSWNAVPLHIALDPKTYNSIFENPV